jgi:hypothetical protein
MSNDRGSPTPPQGKGVSRRYDKWKNVCQVAVRRETNAKGELTQNIHRPVRPPIRSESGDGSDVKLLFFTFWSNASLTNRRMKMARSL